jgi:murein DD-endopeptidase MepM/ murein hydrolase activator NlpD
VSAADIHVHSGEPAETAIDLGEIERSLDRIESTQISVVTSIGDGLDHRTERIASILERLGLSPRRRAGSARTGYDLSLGTGFDSFVGGVNQVALQIEDYTAVREFARALPLLRPMASGRLSSGFGTRTDPFTRRPAAHQGTDFRAPTGTEVKATGNGRVVLARANGGYGKMVEIDHGNGVRTRYAHLSRVLVSTGQRVSAGQLVGQVGSTGRSTGPHLHYEVRVNGRPIDPMRYFRAGSDLVALF